MKNLTFRIYTDVDELKTLAEADRETRQQIRELAIQKANAEEIRDAQTSPGMKGKMTREINQLQAQIDELDSQLNLERPLNWEQAMMDFHKLLDNTLERYLTGLDQFQKEFVQRPTRAMESYGDAMIERELKLRKYLVFAMGKDAPWFTNREEAIEAVNVAKQEANPITLLNRIEYFLENFLNRNLRELKNTSNHTMRRAVENIQHFVMVDIFEKFSQRWEGSTYERNARHYMVYLALMSKLEIIEEEPTRSWQTRGDRVLVQIATDEPGRAPGDVIQKLYRWEAE